MAHFYNYFLAPMNYRSSFSERRSSVLTRFVHYAAFIVLFLICSALSAAGISDSGLKSCTDEHIHRCADLRIRAVRVREVDDRGVEYEDVEDNSIGVPGDHNHRWEFSRKFELA
jgi:hypothetical protein